MLVGNDIVDLHDPWSQSDKIHARFDSRVFTSIENSYISASNSAHRSRWLLWAAKESTFKVARKINAKTQFFPKKFIVRMTGKTSAEVVHDSIRFGVCFEITDEWLHALAEPIHQNANSFDPSCSRSHTCVRSVNIEELGISSNHKSSFVREVARTTASSLVNILPGDIEIINKSGVPFFFCQGERLPIGLSLSHHGRFVACALAMDESLKLSSA